VWSRNGVDLIMTDEIVHITVDGVSLEAKKGQMLIEVTDKAGIDIPRFCYHKKLSVAANCRMCLVEVEKAPKPLPACATPVMPDMVVKTNSQYAKSAQQGTMEFLLINHPLDCPICDQGGECELQDVAMGYGADESQYKEAKRVVIDKYIGPLISTEMTRCIHCTRCVRFGEEIAGVREMGATGRGEHVRIGTYIEASISSELSGNIIDICPVGALTAKPSRFKARAWEVEQFLGISPHDTLGSNTYIHVYKGRVLRVVPRENESINELWISDRDRFAYQGLNSSARSVTPMLRIDGVLQECDWEEAINGVKKILQSAVNPIAALVSAYSTNEEMYLAQKLVRALGSNDIDHRIGQVDFSDQHNAPVMPWLNMQMSDLQTLDSALFIDSFVHKDQPILGVRLRKAVQKGAQLSFINSDATVFNFTVYEHLIANPDNTLINLLCIAKAAGARFEGLSALPDVEINESHKRIALSLSKAGKSAVVLGAQSVVSPHFSILRALAQALSEATGSHLSYFPEAGNTCGAWLSACVPHRKPGGAPAEKIGRNAAEILSTDNEALILMGVEPELDAGDTQAAMASLKGKGKTIVMSHFISDFMLSYADVILPQSVFTESAGTYVNLLGHWQSSDQCIKPLQQSKPGWKILCEMAITMGCEGFTYQSISEISDDLKQQCNDVILDNITSATVLSWPVKQQAKLIRIGQKSIYASDSIVRRAKALQATKGAKISVSINPTDAKKYLLSDGDSIRIEQSGLDLSSEAFSISLNEATPAGCLSVPFGIAAFSYLGPLHSAINLVKV
jgi:NADH-quinone oxidoreductase subunit G